ncbi:MAG: TIGR04283 family arsenosugar biosynthesis glycosyltransferase [Gammaproteobacteria bacterium]
MARHRLRDYADDHLPARKTLKDYRAVAFSIIVPVLDEAAALPALLTSLAPWRNVGAEIIVADGGSLDASVEIAERGGAKVVRCERGRARQMNAGAAAAHGDVLLFLHADTRLPETTRETITQAVAANARWGFFALTIVGRHPLLAVIARAASLRSRLTGIATGDQAIFVTRELFDTVGGFPDIPLMEDIAFSRRLRERAHPAKLKLKAETSARRWEQGGMLRTVFLMWRLRLAYALGTSPAKLARRYADVRERR